MYIGFFLSSGRCILAAGVLIGRIKTTSIPRTASSYSIFAANQDSCCQDATFDSGRGDNGLQQRSRARQHSPSIFLFAQLFSLNYIRHNSPMFESTSKNSKNLALATA